MAKHQVDYSLKKPEQAILIGVISKGEDLRQVQEYIDELEFLAHTAGAVTKKKFLQRLYHPDPRFYIGQGKLEEIGAFIKANGINLAIFDDELSPSQIRNLEKAVHIRIIDRTNLILDIFAKRARTARSRVQVELAQYQYLLPRLTRMWTHLEKQQGGIGTRGPGEKEIETDRRVIRDKLSKLKEELETIARQTAVQRKKRNELIRVALVGYTNAGKSTLMNVLSKADVFAENKLFATLDTTVRKVVIDERPFLLADTVGFIRKLPHHLVESFKSTLDEVREADILLHVTDLSHPNFEEHIGVVNETLAELGAAGKPTILVMNKADAFRWEEDDQPREEVLAVFRKSWMSKLGYPVVFISALKKENIAELQSSLITLVKELYLTRYPENTNPKY
ncbi:MAG: GTPase HflX [Bacteroidia bacterium]|nr:GTPase HflX [Bacteroidia bacterium]MCZ2278050.1 GTPase HflX [Bacteroidia bacterium]